MGAWDGSRERIRVLGFVAVEPAKVAAAAKADALLLSNRKGTVLCSTAVMDAMNSERLIRTASGTVSLTHLGMAAHAELTADDRFASQHRQLETAAMAVDGSIQPVSVNLSESPLGALMRRKDDKGRSYLSDREFAAGERLRSDYTRAHIMPRLGANWEASVASKGRRHGGAAADLTATALAARQRVEKAIAAVGPELSGVLIDVCCFLKGLERVERERSWPVRSGKLILKTALSTLARHYTPPASVERRSPLHWGSDDYRPSIG